MEKVLNGWEYTGLQSSVVWKLETVWKEATCSEGIIR